MWLRSIAFVCFAILVKESCSVTLKNGDIKLDLVQASAGLALKLSLNGSEKISAVLGEVISQSSLLRCEGASACLVSFGNSTLNISDVDGGFSLAWESNEVQRTFVDCVHLKRDELNWFGGPECSQADWPVEKLVMPNTAYVVSKDQNRAVSERYWLNSKGGYVYVAEDVPLFIDQNSNVKDNLCLMASLRRPYTGRSLVRLAYTLVAKANPREGHQHAVDNFLGKPTGHPNRRIIEKPIWTTWAKYKSKINDDIVVAFAKDIVEHGFSGQLEIDDIWEDCYGSTRFDSNSFGRINVTVALLHQMGFTVTIWTHPFVNENCKLAQVGLENDYFIRNADGVAKTTWWNGKGYHIDFTKQEGRDWYVTRLKLLQHWHGIDSFKFDAGETDWAPQVPVLNGDIELAPNLLTSNYVRTCATFGDLVEVRSAWRTQDLPVFVRMIDKDSRWNNQNGLYTLITTLLQMNLNGYTMVLPDMVGGNGYGTPPTAELLARWTQANVFMPTMQFSYLPWEITSDQFDGLAIIRKSVALHEQYADVILAAMNDSITKGTPVNPPIWWVDPENELALPVDDQYLLGETVLVAPVIEQGAVSRDVVLPRGTWKDGNTGKIYQGPQIVKDYPAPIDVLPYFLKC